MPSPALPRRSSAPRPSIPPPGLIPTCPMAGRCGCWPGCRRWRNCTDGTLLVRADMVEVDGRDRRRPAAQATITRTLSDKLGQGQAFTVNVRYDKALDPHGRSADAAGMRGRR